MSSSQPQYEFTTQQNDQISSLAHKMGVVGCFLITVGALNIIIGLLLIAAIYQHELPGEWVSQVPEEVRSKVNELPPNHQLWGFVINAGVGGLIYILLGVWTRASAASFREIVKTEGNDVDHLMNALASLNRMYGLVYTLLMITLLLILVGVGMALYQQFT